VPEDIVNGLHFLECNNKIVTKVADNRYIDYSCASKTSPEHSLCVLIACICLDTSSETPVFKNGNIQRK
jgi:hypothetical protein